MPTLRHHTRYIFAALLALALAGCSGKKDAAQSLVWEIAATLSAAEPEAAKYIPEQLAEVQTKLTDLRAAFDKKDYAGVIAAAPGVLDQAQALATAAAAKKDQILKAQNDAWTNLAAVLPDEVTALQGRLNELNSKKPVKKARSGTPKAVDLTAAGAAMTDITALWSKAQAAFAGGNLDEAVATATDVKARADALSVTL
jgi:PBP1b-binding outer membrane lipoprotein LpoB